MSFRAVRAYPRVSPNHHAARPEPSRILQVGFGRTPKIATRAPGRINVIGEHVDYQAGLVMPAAIDRYVFASARTVDVPEVQLWSAEIGGEPLVIPLRHDQPLEGDAVWANYVFGTIASYRDAGHPVSGLQIAFESTVPPGAGLSSSAAIEAATALAIEAAGDFTLSPKERALLCQKADHDYVGVRCGIMDQLAVNAGVEAHLLNIDCRSLDVVPTRLPDELALVAVDSCVAHSHAGGEYGARRADCEAAAEALGVDSLRDTTLDAVNAKRDELDDRIFRRARHVVSEIARVTQFSDALAAGDSKRAGELLFESHASLRDDFEVSCPELDSLVDIATDLGALGARLMGGGFGGCTINLVRANAAETFATDVFARYHQEHATKATAFTVHPVAGASIQ